MKTAIINLVYADHTDRHEVDFKPGRNPFNAIDKAIEKKFKDDELWLSWNLVDIKADDVG